MSRCLTIVVGIPCLFAHAALAQNAAVKYLRADASLRQAYSLPPDAAAKLEKLLESPLDAEAENLVAAADEALTEFHHAAAGERCEWALSSEDGPFANTSHRGAIREMVALAGLRGRLRFHNGNLTGATSDALAALAAARHLSTDGTLASVLIGYKLENAIFGVLAGNLYRLSRVQLQQLADRLAALPSGANLATALVTEKVDRKSDFLAIVEGAKSREEVIERLVKGVPALQSNAARAAEVVDGCGASPSGLLHCIAEQQAFYRTMASRFALSPEQFESQFAAESAALSRTNLLIRQFTPNLPRFRWMDAYMQTRRALLVAAIGLEAEGTEVLPRYLDPYDSRAFSYTQLPHGFRLESHLREDGNALSISIAAGT